MSKLPSSSFEGSETKVKPVAEENLGNMRTSIPILVSLEALSNTQMLVNDNGAVDWKRG